MTTISGLDSYYPSRSRLRDAKTEEDFASVAPATSFTADDEKSSEREQETISSAVNSFASLASSLWDIEQLKSDPTTLSGETVDTSTSDSLLEELQKWSQMSPGEMIRAKLLEQMGLSEEELAALPADERQVIEDKIKDAIKQSLTGDDGQSGASGDNQVSAASAL